MGESKTRGSKFEAVIKTQSGIQEKLFRRSGRQWLKQVAEVGLEVTRGKKEWNDGLMQMGGDSESWQEIIVVLLILHNSI